MQSWNRVTAVACVVSTFITTCLAFSEQARAGTYLMRNCDIPTHAGALVGPWLAVPAPNMAWNDACAAGGGFGFSLPGDQTIDSMNPATLDLVSPSDGTRGAIAIRRVQLRATTRLVGAGAVLQVNAMTTNIGGAVRKLGMITPPGSNSGATRYDTGTLGSLTNQFRLTLQCGEENAQVGSPDCYPSNDVPLEVRSVEVTLSEDAAPVVSLLGGSLLDTKSVSGVGGLRYSASDPESGVARIEAVIGDSILAVRDLSAGCRYVDFTACATEDRGELTVDTRQVANGQHPLILRAFDAAGNRRDSSPEIVYVQNGLDPRSSRQTPDSIDSRAQARLTARFADSARSTRTVPFSRRVTVRGRLTTTSKRGIGNARIEVLERPARAGARERGVGHARTRADGTYSYVLAPRRSSRTIRLAYRPKPGAPAASAHLTLRVRAASSLKVALRGTTVRFSGRVLTGSLPPGGKRVTLQGRAPGFSWASFAGARTTRGGRFAGSYRLPVRRPGVRLQIRVVVPAEHGYPYLRYSGRPVTLRVR